MEKEKGAERGWFPGEKFPLFGTFGPINRSIYQYVSNTLGCWTFAPSRHPLMKAPCWNIYRTSKFRNMRIVMKIFLLFCEGVVGR